MQPPARGQLKLLRVPILLAAVELFRMARLLALPDGRMVNGMADDSFYYLQLARNFAATGRWSLDGAEPATGFHLLWAYLLAALYRVAPHIGLHALYLVAELFQIACLTAACAFAVRTATRLFGPAAELGVAVIFLSTLSLEVGGLLMEAPLAILLAAAVIWLLCREGPPRASLRFAFVLGVTGVLARSDFALLPAVLLAFHLLRRSPLKRLAAATFGGAVAGLVVIVLHTHAISGEWVQSSARQKLFWASLQGYSIRPIGRLLLEYINSSLYTPWRTPRGIGVSAAIAAALICCATGWRIWRSRAQPIALLLGAQLALVAAYLLLYRFDSAGIQSWYIASFQIPIALLTGAAFAAIRARPLAIALAGALCLWGIAGSWRTNPGDDAPLYVAGIYVRDHPELKPAAAFNAGIIAYFAGGGVTNLDGLVNDRIYPYAVSGDLLGYLRQHDIRTLADFRAMVEPDSSDPAFLRTVSRRYGYSDGQLQRCLTSVVILGDAGLYRIDR